MKRIIAVKESLIKESPDNIWHPKKGEFEVKSGNSKSYSFEVIVDNDTREIKDVLVAKEPNLYHGEDSITGGRSWGYANQTYADNDDKKTYPFDWVKVYPGRLFMKPKVITFWVYPSVEELKTIIRIIEKKLKRQLVGKGWSIEVYPEGMENAGQQEYSNNYDRDQKSEMIPIEKFVGSRNSPEKEYLQHLDTKTKHKVPDGYGSKNPKYRERRQWQMATVGMESKTEKMYPRLFEDLADKYAERQFYIPNEHDEFEKAYASENIKDEIVYEYKNGEKLRYNTIRGKNYIIKNPTSLENIDSTARGIIDEEGNLYVIYDSYLTHNEILDTLDKLDLVQTIEGWWRIPPTKFVSVQRVYNENAFHIGESYLTVKAYKKLFSPFFEKAKQKNPQFKFYNKTFRELGR